MRWISVSSLWLMSCAGSDRTVAPPSSSPPPAPVAEAPAPIEAPVWTVESLYDSCRERVERPEAQSECTTNEDCTRAGGSMEICTTTLAAQDLISTAELRPCFHVLEACSCQEGVCSWTLKDTLPPELDPQMQNRLPGSLPLTKPASSE